MKLIYNKGDQLAAGPDKLAEARLCFFSRAIWLPLLPSMAALTSHRLLRGTKPLDRRARPGAPRPLPVDVVFVIAGAARAEGDADCRGRARSWRRPTYAFTAGSN